MPEDPVRAAIEALRVRLREELDSQFASLTDRHDQELEAARRTVEAEVEQRWAGRVDAVRAEWSGRLESEVATVRAEAERRLAAEVTRLRLEAQREAEAAAARAREELDSAVAAERERAAEDQRRAVEEASAGLRADFERTLAEERSRAAAAVEEAAAESSARTREHLAQAIADERQRASAEAEERWTARLEAMRGEWSARLDSELAAVRGEAERRFTAEAARLRLDAQAAVESAARLRDDVDRNLAAERERAAAELETERQNFERTLLGERQNYERELLAARQTIAGLTASRDKLEAALQRSEASLERERQSLSAFSAAREQLDGARLEAEKALEEQRRQVAALVLSRDEAQRALEDARRELDAERRAAAAAIAARQQAESTLRETAASLARERQSVADLSSARTSMQAALDRAQAGVETAAGRGAPAADLADARAAERQSQIAVVERVLDALRRIDRAESLSEALGELIAAAAAESPRAALFIVNGSQLQPWKAIGFDVPSIEPCPGVSDPGLLGEAARRREPVATAQGSGPSAPPFASLPGDRAAIAVPIIVGGQAVAVLYGDDASADEPEAPASWPEALQILGRHAAACLSQLTAIRTLQVLGPINGNTLPVASDTEDGGARRYARLLVSEIKLYNESAVRAGREQRDLLRRLGGEIDRARRLYEERVPASADRGGYFQQELVQTLAGGDPSLLGGPA